MVRINESHIIYYEKKTESTGPVHGIEWLTVPDTGVADWRLTRAEVIASLLYKSLNSNE